MTKNILNRIAFFFLVFTSIAFAQSKDTDDQKALTLLKSISKTYSAIAKKAIPSVVYIQSHYNQGTNNAMSPEDYDNPFDYYNDEFFRRFFGGPGHRQRQQQPPPEQITSGSGFIISKDGHIITNCHVVKDASKIVVTLNNKEEYEATLIGTDPRADIAVIKIDQKDQPFLDFGNSDDLEIAEWVMAIGSPFSFQSTVTRGIVSAKGRSNLQINDLEDFIQTDAVINPGNSGGPLLNLDGQVIGVNAAIASRSGGYMGIGFAIPSNMVKNIAEQIMQNGTVQRGYIGISLQPVDKEMAEALNLDKTEGILISEVVKDSPAEKAGIKQGDILLSCNNKPIKDAGLFRNQIGLMAPDEKVTFDVLRDGKKLSITVVLGTYPEHKMEAAKQSSQLGIEVSAVSELPSETLHKFGYNADMENVIITAIKTRSLAERAGLRPGMLLLQVNQQKIKNMEDFHNAMNDMNKKKHVLLLVRFQNVTRFITIKLK